MYIWCILLQIVLAGMDKLAESDSYNNIKEIYWVGGKTNIDGPVPDTSGLTPGTACHLTGVTLWSTMVGQPRSNSAFLWQSLHTSPLLKYWSPWNNSMARSIIHNQQIKNNKQKYAIYI